MKTPRSHNAFTLIELLVVIAIIAILASLAIPAVTGAMVKGQLVQTTNNGKQIALAASGLAFDGVATGDPNLGWPGDLAEATGQGVEQVNNLSNYVTRLIDYDKLQKGDVAKIFSAPGVPQWNGQGEFSSNNSAFKIYKVKENDPGSTLLVATKNYRYNNNLDNPEAKPYGNKGFVVVRKGGDGTAYTRQQGRLLMQIGTLPGNPDPNSPGTETNQMYWE